MKQDGLLESSPFAAALDYQPWYDIASRVRHREGVSETNEDWISPMDDKSVIAVTIIAVMTGDPHSEAHLPLLCSITFPSPNMILSDCALRDRRAL
jgi:hypothetical protein